MKVQVCVSLSRVLKQSYFFTFFNKKNHRCLIIDFYRVFTEKNKSDFLIRVSYNQRFSASLNKYILGVKRNFFKSRKLTVCRAGSCLQGFCLRWASKNHNRNGTTSRVQYANNGGG